MADERKYGNNTRALDDDLRRMAAYERKYGTRPIGPPAFTETMPSNGGGFAGMNPHAPYLPPREGYIPEMLPQYYASQKPKAMDQRMDSASRSYIDQLSDGASGMLKKQGIYLSNDLNPPPDTVELQMEQLPDGSTFHKQVRTPYPPRNIAPTAEEIEAHLKAKALRGGR